MASFFVQIVESLNISDISGGRSESAGLYGILKLASIDTTLFSAHDRTTFVKTLEVLDARIVGDPRLQENPQPVLHISAHGSTDGLMLANGEMLKWTDLADYLAPINQSCGGRLLVCMSTCHGFTGSTMARIPGRLKPYWGILGPTGAISWPDAAVGFLTFYHLSAKSFSIESALCAMRAASGFAEFDFVR